MSGECERRTPMEPENKLTRIPQTNEISRAVGIIWKTMDCKRKLIPFVPRSIALVRPPVCLDRWKFRSSFSRWSKTVAATRRMAFCATLAKTALRISWNTAAPILVAPSEGGLEEDETMERHVLTCENSSTSNSDSGTTNSSKIYVHRIYNRLEIEGNLNVQNLGCH